jgi:hypothetical protein
MKKILIALGVLLISTQIAMAEVWQVRKIKNDFEGYSFVRIHTEYLKLNQPLEFPYRDLKVVAAVDCSDNSETFHLIFSMNPNFTNYTLQKADNKLYKLVAVEVKRDGDRVSYTNYAINNTGSSQLIFNNKYLLNTKILMLQMDFYSGTRHITIDMSKRPKCSEHITKQ